MKWLGVLPTTTDEEESSYKLLSIPLDDVKLWLLLLAFVFAIKSAYLDAKCYPAGPFLILGLLWFWCVVSILPLFYCCYVLYIDDLWCPLPPMLRESSNTEFWAVPMIDEWPGAASLLVWWWRSVDILLLLAWCCRESWWAVRFCLLITFSISLILFSLIFGRRFISITALLWEEVLLPADWDGRVLAAVVEFEDAFTRSIVVGRGCRAADGSVLPPRWEGMCTCSKKSVDSLFVPCMSKPTTFEVEAAREVRGCER